jgi:hypothetical protein
MFEDNAPKLGVQGTFLPNHKESVHRWYPYLEGFSFNFAQSLLDEFGRPNCRVHDPFGGTGTTVTVAAENGMRASYSEINPFMRLVIECKTNRLRSVAHAQAALAEYFSQLEAASRENVPSYDEAVTELKKAFGERPFFIGARLQQIIAIKRAIENSQPPCSAFGDFARLALGSIAVACSEMKRAADLRYRHPKEKLPDDLSVFDLFHQKLNQIIADVDARFERLPPVVCVSHSALIEPKESACVDLVVTSPPYLNGTNYFRNTKIELWLTGFLSSEKELGAFRDQAMAAGINDISKRGRQPVLFPEVEAIATRLDEVAYDGRIPEMVRRYFSDSGLWMQNIYKLLVPQGIAVIDIGDSRFAGIHVPTDDLLVSLAKGIGFCFEEKRLVRSRKSKDGTTLSQVLLILRKPSEQPAPRRTPSTDDFKNAALEFERELPQTQPPYASRNWGHGLHSLCSYQGKLKPAIAHFLVQRFSSEGETILDPMAGSGTIPLEAFLQSRRALGNDLQELGYILTRAKVERGASEAALCVCDALLAHVERTKDAQDLTTYADFGLNGKLPEYFHETTFREVLAARQYLKKHPCNSWGRAIVYACLLHILHGNRPYALSRTSHPVTPFSPTGDFDYRPLAPRLKDKLVRTLALEIPTQILQGTATQKPFDALPYEGSIDVVITSPPFAASTRFFSSNWMRLWLAGWEAQDFTNRRAHFLEHKQRKSLDIYHDFFDACARWLRTDGRLVMHVGRTATVNMAEELIKRSGKRFELVHSFDENVAGREKFGIRDQGATTTHQYLFFRRLD